MEDLRAVALREYPEFGKAEPYRGGIFFAFIVAASIIITLVAPVSSGARIDLTAASVVGDMWAFVMVMMRRL